MNKNIITSNPGIYLIRINDVLGHLYIPEKKTNKAIIHAKGGPSLGDDGDSALWPVASKNNYILFVPDYIGYCHSYGVFNFENCVNTIYEAENFLNGTTPAIDTLSGIEIKLECTDILLIGSSWGASIAPFISKYKKSSIQNIGLIKPVTNWKTQGKTTYPEENTTETNHYLSIGWENVYRDYINSEWPKIFNGELSEFNPIDNINLLKDKNIFIVHGKKDTAIHWEKSLNYVNEYKKVFPQKQIYAKFAQNGDHSSKFTAKGLQHIINEIKKT